MDNKPLCYGVLLADGIIIFTAPWQELCHEHINDAMTSGDDDRFEEFRGSRVIPLYTTPQKGN